MGIFRAIVEPLMGAVLDPWHNLALGGSVGGEFVGDEPASADVLACAKALSIIAAQPLCSGGFGRFCRGRIPPDRQRARDSVSRH